MARLSSDARWGYNKLCRKAGEFALAIGAVLDDPERDRFRAVIGATMGRPIVVTDSRQVRGPDGKGMDEAALLRLFDRYGISDRAARLTTWNRRYISKRIATAFRSRRTAPP